MNSEAQENSSAQPEKKAAKASPVSYTHLRAHET